MKKHYIYILECADKTYYTGYTIDLKNRLKHHNSTKQGAKYTRIRRPVSLKYFEEFETIAEALKRERQLKTLTKAKKEALINTQSVI